MFSLVSDRIKCSGDEIIISQTSAQVIAYPATMRQQVPVERKFSDKRFKMGQKYRCIFLSPCLFEILLGGFEALESCCAFFISAWVLSRKLIWILAHHHSPQLSTPIWIFFFQPYFNGFFVAVFDKLGSMIIPGRTQKSQRKRERC